MTSPANRAPSPELTELMTQRMVATPDVLRTRGLTVSGLLMTLIGAITAGILFTDREISSLAKWAAMALIFLSAVALGLFASAGLYAQRGKVDPGKEREQLKQVINVIASRLTIAGWVSIAATMAAIFLAVVLLWYPPTKEDARIVVNMAGVAHISTLCPGVKQNFPAKIEAGQLKAGNPLITLTVAASNCGGKAGNVSLTIKREYIQAVLVSE